MIYLESFGSYKKKKVIETNPKEFTGKKNTYLYDDIFDDPKTGFRMGTCKNCKKVVDIIEHDPLECK